MVQWLLTSSLTTVPVTDCCPDPDPYLTSWLWRLTLWCPFISFTELPHVTVWGLADTFGNSDPTNMTARLDNRAQLFILLCKSVKVFNSYPLTKTVPKSDNPH